MNGIDEMKTRGLVRLESGVIVTAEEMKGCDSARLAAFRSGRGGPDRSSISKVLPKASATVKAPAPKIDVQAERAAAQSAERQRWATVFASEASKGRERHAATLLGCSDGFSAANIISALSKGPTDADRERAKASKAAGDVWGRVIGKMASN